MVSRALKKCLLLIGCAYLCSATSRPVADPAPVTAAPIDTFQQAFSQAGSGSKPFEIGIVSEAGLKMLPGLVNKGYGEVMSKLKNKAKKGYVQVIIYPGIKEPVVLLSHPTALTIGELVRVKNPSQGLVQAQRVIVRRIITSQKKVKVQTIVKKNKIGKKPMEHTVNISDIEQLTDSKGLTLKITSQTKVELHPNYLIITDIFKWDMTKPKKKLEPKDKMKLVLAYGPTVTGTGDKLHADFKTTLVKHLAQYALRFAFDNAVTAFNSQNRKVGAQLQFLPVPVARWLFNKGSKIVMDRDHGKPIERGVTGTTLQEAFPFAANATCTGNRKSRGGSASSRASVGNRKSRGGSASPRASVGNRKSRGGSAASVTSLTATTPRDRTVSKDGRGRKRTMSKDGRDIKITMSTDGRASKRSRTSLTNVSVPAVPLLSKASAAAARKRSLSGSKAAGEPQPTTGRSAGVSPTKSGLPNPQALATQIAKLKGAAGKLKGAAGKLKSNLPSKPERLINSLPEGWTSASDPSDSERIYYINLQGISQWEHPTHPLPEGWTAHKDKTQNRIYYRNVYNTKLTQLVRPTEPARKPSTVDRRRRLVRAYARVQARRRLARF